MTKTKIEWKKNKKIKIENLIIIVIYSFLIKNLIQKKYIYNIFVNVKKSTHLM